jgi:hypothetical protein
MIIRLNTRKLAGESRMWIKYKGKWNWKEEEGNSDTLTVTIKRDS